MFWFRKLGKQRVIRCRRPVFLLRSEHAYPSALAAIYSRAQLAQGTANLFIQKLAEIVFGPSVLLERLGVLRADNQHGVRKQREVFVIPKARHRPTKGERQLLGVTARVIANL